jgi:hypothetical protein
METMISLFFYFFSGNALEESKNMYTLWSLKQLKYTSSRVGVSDVAIVLLVKF